MNNEPLAAYPIHRVKQPISSLRFWFNPYVTVIITAPLAFLIGFNGLWYTINGLFKLMVLLLWSPLVFLVGAVLWIWVGLLPVFPTVFLLEWLPQLWNKSWNVFWRLLAMIGAYIAGYVGSMLLYNLSWGFIGWIGASPKAIELLSRTPGWLEMFGIVVPGY